jgi:hypothetical protein
MSPLHAEPVASETEEEVGAPPADPIIDRPALTYDPDSGRVSRRQFRFLLILTLVNTLMLGGFVVGPGLSKLAGGWWQDYKRWRSDREAAKQRQAARAKRLADYGKLLAHADPPDKVVYDEDQERAAKLIGSGAYFRSRSGGNFIYLTPRPWQFPAEAPPPTGFQFIAAPPGAPLFVHGRKSARGQERLVWVTLEARQGSSEETRFADAPRRFMIRTQRQLGAQSFAPDSTADGVLVAATRYLEILDRETRVTWTRTTSWENGAVEVEPEQVMRFFAGQPDPIDQSHFTIAYELNGRRDVLDGYLKDDDTVTLEPRQGRIVYSDAAGRNRRWDPFAERPATAPATRPAK